VLQIQPSGRSFLIALLPLGSALAQPLGIEIDGKERIQLGYFLPGTCDIAGCTQKAPMTPARLERMKNARTISIMGIDVTGQRELSLPLPCCRFKAAYDGAASEAGTKEELYIKEFLRRRFADFMRMDWEKLCFDVPASAQQKSEVILPAQGAVKKRSEAC